MLEDTNSPDAAQTATSVGIVQSLFTLSQQERRDINVNHDKTKRVFGSFRPGQTQTGLRSHRS